MLLATTSPALPGYPFKVLDTDYKSYAVAHVCLHPGGIGTIEHFWVYARSRKSIDDPKMAAKIKSKGLGAVKSRALEEYADVGSANSFLEPVYQGKLCVN